jgi:hypothetical protein
MRSVRNGDWKLVVDGNHIFVFNLRQDVGERNDLTYRRTDIANRLRPMLTKWEQEMDAEARVHFPDSTATQGAALHAARVALHPRLARPRARRHRCKSNSRLGGTRSCSKIFIGTCALAC